MSILMVELYQAFINRFGYSKAICRKLEHLGGYKYNFKFIHEDVKHCVTVFYDGNSKGLYVVQHHLKYKGKGW